MSSNGQQDISEYFATIDASSEEYKMMAAKLYEEADELDEVNQRLFLRSMGAYVPRRKRRLGEE